GPPRSAACPAGPTGTGTATGSPRRRSPFCAPRGLPFVPTSSAMSYRSTRDRGCSPTLQTVDGTSCKPCSPPDLCLGRGHLEPLHIDRGGSRPSLRRHRG